MILQQRNPAKVNKCSCNGTPRCSADCHYTEASGRTCAPVMPRITINFDMVPVGKVFGIANVHSIPDIGNTPFDFVAFVLISRYKTLNPRHRMICHPARGIVAPIPQQIFLAR